MATLPRWTGRHTVRRRLVQLACLAVFVLVPLFGLVRFDFAAGRVHLFGAEIWLDEWAILWLALMLGMWLIGALSLVFGRVYCAYACPQMVFSELAHDFDALGKRLLQPLRHLTPAARKRAARGISLTLTALLSLAASVFFLAWFVPLPEVVSRLLHLDFGLWVGAIGAATALVAFLDFALVREGFCRSVCPYGLLQGVIEDGRSLHVRFDTGSPCIECQACVRACPMGIDIRDGAFQIECTRCGSCIDACDAVLGRLKRPGLLSFELAGLSFSGFDLKRILVSAATLAFAAVFAWTLATRERIAVRLSPVYAESAASSTHPAARTEARFLLRAENRGRTPVILGVRPEGLPPGTRVLGLADPTVPAGRERRFDLVVHVPPGSVRTSVTPFVWVVKTPEGEKRFASSLFLPGRAT